MKKLQGSSVFLTGFLVEEFLMHGKSRMLWQSFYRLMRWIVSPPAVLR